MMALQRLVARWRAWRRPPSLGARGEAAAARYLCKKGYKIVARGLHDGALDLVAVDGRTVVFVEVKTRQSEAAGAPETAVSSDQQRRLSRAAAGFIARHHLQEYSARFDVVAILWPAGQRTAHIEHVLDAFGPAEGS